MSLDVCLISKEPMVEKGIGLFINEDGIKKELKIKDIMDKYPNIIFEKEFEERILFEANITHNLNKMADAAGIYKACWRPEEINAVKAQDIISILENGLKKLKEEPEFYKQFNAPNGWGKYEHFLPWVEKYLNACREFPDAYIDVSR